MTKTTTTVYRHPDGFELSYSDHELIATDDDDNVVRLPIGLMKLAELAEKLTAIAGDSASRAEEYGRAVAESCLDAVMDADNADARAIIIQAALFDLQGVVRHDRAAAGFASAIESVLTDGLAHLS